MRSLGQIPLVIGALAIFSTLQVSISTALLQSMMVSIDGEASLDAMSIGQTMLDEIMKKGFAEETLTSRIYDRTELRTANMFGPDSGEVLTLPETSAYSSDLVFDDLDDYQGYSRIVTSPRLGDFLVVDSIYYMQEANQNLIATSQTWYKQVVIYVSNQNLSQPIKIQSLTVYRRFF